MCHQCVQTVLHVALDVTLRTLRVRLASLEFMKGNSNAGLEAQETCCCRTCRCETPHRAMRERGREWRDPPLIERAPAFNFVPVVTVEANLKLEA